MIRTLLAAWIAATALVLLLATDASAQNYFYGSNVTFSQNGTGRFTAYHYPSNGGGYANINTPFGGGSSGGNGEAGVTLAIYGDDGNGGLTADTWGVWGTHPFVNLAAPFLTGSGTTASPYVLQTSYLAGNYDASGACISDPCLRITELAEYHVDVANPQTKDDVYLTYKVDNDGTQPVKYRLTLAADSQIDSSSDGRGFLDGGAPPRMLGTDNANKGAYVAFQEVAGTPWSRYQEGVPFAIYNRIHKALDSDGTTSDGLSDTIADTTTSDKAIAVQWDNHLTSGLAAATEETYETFLHFHDYKSLALTDPGYVMTGPNQPVTVTATVTDRNGNAVALSNSDVRWQIDYGPDENDALGWQTQAPTSVGSNQANVTWHWLGDGTQPAASDEVLVWIDLDHDGVKDKDEPTTYQSADWFDAFRVNPYYSSARINVDSNSFSVDARNSSHQAVQTAFKWKVEGANPQTDYVTDPANGFNDCDTTCAASAVDLVGDYPGTDRITVWEDTNGDSDFSDWGEKRSVNVSWYSGLELSPSASSITQNYQYLDVGIYLSDDSYNDWTQQDVRYQVTGANPQSGVVTTDGYGNASIHMNTANVGEDTLVAWVDTNDDGVLDAGETTRATGNYTVYLSPDQRITTDAGVDGVLNATVGSAVNLGVTIKKADGSADTTHSLRWYTTSGSLDSTDYREQELAPDAPGSNHFTLPLAGGNGQPGSDTVYMYVDSNGNAREDSNEPYESVTVHWNRRAQIYSYSSNTAFVGNSAYVYARLQHADGSAYTGTFNWWVDSGAVQSGTATNSESTNASFLVPSQAAGAHVIHVSFGDTDGTQSDQLTITWKTRYTITLTREHSDLSTGATGKVTIAMVDQQTSLPAAAGTVVHYEISGTNYDSNTNAVELDAQGQAVVTWKGAKAGTDYFNAWPDVDQNGFEDSDESASEKSTTVTFHNRVDLTASFAGKNEDNTQSVTVKFHDDDYNELANKPLAWQITGANAQSGAVTTDAHGTATINWTGNEPGTDTLVVWQDTDADGTPDADEQQSAPQTISWYQRMYAYVTGSNNAVGTPYTVNVNLENLAGSNQSGAVLHWIATGASGDQSGDTPATNASGNTSFSVNSQNGGSDQVTVFLDSNGNGARDTGEPQYTVSMTWTSTVHISCSCSGTKPEGNTQSFTATKDAGAGAGALMYQVYGTHPQPATAYSGGITVNGTSQGYDDVVVWADNDNGGDRDSNEPQAWYRQYWTTRIPLAGATGHRVAGGSVTISVSRLDASGNADLTAGKQLNWTVSGANGPKSGSVTTNSLGKAAITYQSGIQGTDTVTVTDSTTGFVNTTYVYWDAPPVSLALSHNSAASAYQTNTHTVTAQIAGASIPPAGYPVHFSVSGANTVADTTVQSDAAGSAQFTWTGTEDGTDTVHAYADVSGGTDNDGYDPSTTTTMTWLPLVSLSSTTTDQAIGEPHTETVHFVNNSGAALANADVWYQISGANPTGSVLQARQLTSSTGSRIQARTDGSGNVNITWTGANTGTDTLDAWGDSNANNLLDTATDAHATKVVTWRAATAASTAPGGTGTTGTTSAVVTPGSANDFDGVAVPPPPVVAKKVNVAPVKGHVYVRLPKSKKFIELLDAEQIPVGSIVDVRKGTVALTSAQNLRGGVATAQFYAGEFQIAQKRAAKPITDLLLYGGSFKACGKVSRKTKRSSAARKKKIRQLWGKGTGLFRTKGKYAAAAVRGTNWDVVDYCDGTLVKVAQGVVQVQPNKGRPRILKAPKSLFVPAAGLAKAKKK